MPWTTIVVMQLALGALAAANLCMSRRNGRIGWMIAHAMLAGFQFGVATTICVQEALERAFPL